MYIEGRIIKVEPAETVKQEWSEEELQFKSVKIKTKKVYIRQLMTGITYWAYSFDCLVSKQYPDVVRVNGNESFHWVKN